MLNTPWDLSTQSTTHFSTRLGVAIVNKPSQAQPRTQYAFPPHGTSPFLLKLPSPAPLPLSAAAALEQVEWGMATGRGRLLLFVLVLLAAQAAGAARHLVVCMTLIVPPIGLCDTRLGAQQLGRGGCSAPGSMGGSAPACAALARQHCMYVTLAAIRRRCGVVSFGLPMAPNARPPALPKRRTPTPKSVATGSFATWRWAVAGA